MSASTANTRSVRVKRARRVAVTAAAILVAATITATFICTRVAEGQFPFDPGDGFEAHALEVDGVSLRTIEIGEGPAIVFLHGAYGGAEDAIETLAPSLAADFRLISIDRPGHGYSQRGGARHDDPRGQGETIAAALEALGLERPILVGFSYGGAVAADLVARDPSRVGALVLIAAPLLPWGGGSDATDLVLGAPVAGPALAWLGASLLAEAIAPAELDAVFAPEPVAESFDRSPTALAVRPGSLVANSRDIAHLNDELAESAAPYADIDVPVVLLHGLEDRTVWFDYHSEPVAQILPDADLRPIEGAGHLLLYTRTAEVVDAIRSVAARAAR
ncbi:alpha/beta fold hydrolase [Engelhardtia mirabilis]|uniref:2-hydroxy-6-oxononadienedioate/2-hydroxy-6-oxononatrienedioate hydrolase n=1 Tax=Engelhardtia mirabilis TaxID=2528011 RepID=A0A518BIJ9_9BACT|nr:2-hydroxy-6-oxononadienedioate/2-hydroxy-6-oxononatrienedioate hydrolase [Planctomycetes bacterium Pla133]QDV01133.1 2-hydroxy-6-oxononadienedioate/2-hydroxy-6-oxononatrienedioate hydrolase [Planctomycetes bacterium Pla86]